MTGLTIGFSSSIRGGGCELVRKQVAWLLGEDVGLDPFFAFSLSFIILRSYLVITR